MTGKLELLWKLIRRAREINILRNKLLDQTMNVGKNNLVSSKLLLNFYWKLSAARLAKSLLKFERVSQNSKIGWN